MYQRQNAGFAAEIETLVLRESVADIVADPAFGGRTENRHDAAVTDPEFCHRPEILFRPAFRCAVCGSGSEQQQKALQEFNRRKAEGLLVKPLDSDHKIASFEGFGYSKNRY